MGWNANYGCLMIHLDNTNSAIYAGLSVSLSNMTCTQFLHNSTMTDILL